MLSDSKLLVSFTFPRQLLSERGWNCQVQWVTFISQRNLFVLRPDIHTTNVTQTMWLTWTDVVDRDISAIWILKCQEHDDDDDEARWRSSCDCVELTQPILTLLFLELLWGIRSKTLWWCWRSPFSKDQKTIVLAKAFNAFTLKRNSLMLKLLRYKY